MKNKIIGISCNIVKSTDTDSFPGSKLQRIFSDYVEAVKLAGGIPILIPITDDTNIIKAQIELIDGLIISGGYDVNPLNYNEEPHKNLGTTSSLRDFCEFNLLKFAMQKGIPYLGICRGHQVLNVVNGGTLYQDINCLDNFYMSHIQKGDPSKPSHSITINKDSNLYNVFGANYKVNSFHHQSVKTVAPGFKVTATAPDGTIEGIEKINDTNFLMGVQWHPEIMAQGDSKTLDLFKYFISKC